MTLSVNASITGTLARTADLSEVSARLVSAASALAYAQGTASAECDLVYADSDTIAASSSVNLDLAGSLLTPLGTACVFVKVKAIMVIADAANTNDVVVGGADSNGFLGPFGGATHTAAIKPGGCLVIAAPSGGWTVTAGTGDILKIANSSSGTGVNYSIVILGASA